MSYQKFEIEQQPYYSERVGKVYGVWKVVSVEYDEIFHKQYWNMECTLCGTKKRITKPNHISKYSPKCRFQIQKKPKNKKRREIMLNSDSTYIGKKYGIFEIVGIDVSRKDTYWLCKCDLCGKTYRKEPYRIKNQSVKCVCQSTKYDKSYIGNRYNYLTVIGYDKKHNFICRCDCGKIKHIVPVNVINGNVKSCGCMHDKLCSKANIKHGDTLKTSKYHRLYKRYSSMIGRTSNPHNENYKNYGGRGITICNEWRDNYLSFKEWALSNGYRDDLTIDRINVNGNYEPNNCRWADATTQASNRRDSSEWKQRDHFKWTIDGITKDREDWCKEYNVILPTVMYRINVKHMEVKDALSMKKITEGRPRKK